MYVAQDVANRIKLIAKSKKVAMKTLLTDCELGINSVSKMSSGNDILSKNLAKIADYLDCSVDYLLGRTDIVEINKEHSHATSSMHIHGIQNSGGIVGNNHAPVTITIKNGEEHTRELSKQELDLLETYNKSDGRKQFEIMKLIYGTDEK